MNTGKSTSTLTPLTSMNGRKAVRKAKKFSDSSNSPSRRKSLQLLQPVAGDQSQLVGSDGVIRLTNQTSKTPKRKFASDGKSQPKKVFRPDGEKNFTIFEDASSSSSSSTSSSLQTPSAEQEAIDMMTQAEPTPKYWEELAEERRVALEETLKENEKLFNENRELREENDKLKVMADQAEYLADVVETLMVKLDSSHNKGLDNKDDVSRSGSDDEKETDHDDDSDCEEDDENEEEGEEEDEVFAHDEDPNDDTRNSKGSPAREKEDKKESTNKEQEDEV